MTTLRTEAGQQALRNVPKRNPEWQVVQEGGTRADGLAHLAFYLDGAHTQESMAACGHWFADAMLAEQTLEAHHPPPVNSDPRPHQSRHILTNEMQESSSRKCHR